MRHSGVLGVKPHTYLADWQKADGNWLSVPVGQLDWLTNIKHI